MTDKATKPQTDTQTDIATYRLNRPKGRFSEKEQTILCLQQDAEIAVIKLICNFTPLSIQPMFSTLNKEGNADLTREAGEDLSKLDWGKIAS